MQSTHVWFEIELWKRPNTGETSWGKHEASLSKGRCCTDNKVSTEILWAGMSFLRILHFLFTGGCPCFYEETIATGGICITPSDSKCSTFGVILKSSSVYFVGKKHQHMQHQTCSIGTTIKYIFISNLCVMPYFGIFYLKCWSKLTK